MSPPAKPAAKKTESASQWVRTLVGRSVSIITGDGRNIVGTLRGTDDKTSVILEGCHERVYSPDAGVEQVPLGLYIIRGDNIAIVGELDEETDAATDLGQIKAQPLKPVVH